MTGVVYFLQAAPDGPIKIGWAKDREAVDRRLRAAQLGHPAPLRVLRVMDGGRVLEGELHRRFAGDRIHGEWFQPSPRLIRYISQATPTLDLRDSLDVEAIRNAPQRWRPDWRAVALAILLLGGLAGQLATTLVLPVELAAVAVVLVARHRFTPAP